MYGPSCKGKAMAAKSDFVIDRRVAIALDALTPSQKATLEPVLEDKETFVAREKRPGATKRLSSSKSLYSMNAGNGLRIFYSKSGDRIVILDVMRKATMDRLGAKKKVKASGVRKSPGGEVMGS
jgi:hypothetical protein